MTSKPVLSLFTLLSVFASFSDSQLRQPPTPAVRRVIARLPCDQTVYDDIAVQLVSAGLDSENHQDRYERLVTILRVLLYEDGRSELAMYRLADATTAQERTQSLAISPLAALANYYRQGGNPSLPIADLIPRLDRYATVEPLFNNAMACKRNLLRAPRK